MNQPLEKYNVKFKKFKKGQSTVGEALIAADNDHNFFSES